MKLLQKATLLLIIFFVPKNTVVAQLNNSGKHHAIASNSNDKKREAMQTFDVWYREYDLENRKGFWDQAEMMEVVLDAYEVTKSPIYLERFDKLYKHFITLHREDWMYNEFNDDITWAVLFCVRAYQFTGNKVYLQKAKDQFDKMYARAYTPSYGGGLIWNESKTSKNACINGPAMVACCYLAQSTGDTSYYDKAIDLYKWSKINLFDPPTGKVNDAINLDEGTQTIKVFPWSSTYNQGTYLGAAILLYKYTKDQRYLKDAEKIATYTKDTMYKGLVMNNEDNGEDLPGFKGILARYARIYISETKDKSFADWMLLNATTAYKNRNALGLIHTKWATKTPEGIPESAFGCSTAVSLLINTSLLK